MEIGYIEVECPKRCADCFYLAGDKDWRCLIMECNVKGSGIITDICAERPEFCPIRPKQRKLTKLRRTCKGCIDNEDGFCDRKGKYVTDDDYCDSSKDGE